MNTVKTAYTIFAPKKPNKGILRVKIKFTDTKNTYEVVLVEAETARNIVDSGDFVAVPGLIILEEASIEKLKSILGDLVSSGFFDGLVPSNS